ncbi:COX15/CtaA family protein [Devosia algicola]|uniref:Heme A synthase n=1 Tax=Devosia algicola TaxID=3026418 RepID=A0ABY7YP11_9HYPH|nr:COX15/CtaA family protein [Devosia algicola]WDR03041.1 COX15/CtaA family protein [Devosia algicola]
MTIAQDAASIPTTTAPDRLRPVRIWLYVMAALVLGMVVVGGITRLTDSGLSITSWKPISGIIPPLSDADWQAEFDAYKTIPQYEVLNSWMTLDNFKAIFFWEYLHRLIGRLLGFAFLAPFAVFLLQRRLPRRLAWPLFGLFVLGGFQGLLGWWMVTSGLTQLTSVSQYRLAAHLCAASLLFMALVFVPRWLKPGALSGIVLPRHFWSAGILLALIFIQIGAGAFVAGLDAGMGYNTWPLMDGSIIPNGLGVIDPWWRNLFENALTVQFIHRCIAYLVVLYLGLLIWRQSRTEGFLGVHGWLTRLGLLVLVQVALGIATLLNFVPLSLAIGHQAMAFMLAGAVVAYLADMVRNRQNLEAVI